MAIMKILVDSNLVFNYVLGRSHQNSPSLSPELVALIKNKEIDAFITIQGFKKIKSYLKIFNSAKAEKVAQYLESIFRIFDNYDSGFDFEAIRQCQNIEKANELMCLVKFEFDALVTENKDDYSEAYYGHFILRDLQFNRKWQEWKDFFWDQEEVLKRYKLNKLLKVPVTPISNKHLQLSLIEIINKNIVMKYLIRNNHQTVLKAFRILQDVGFCGMEKRDFMNKLTFSKNTAQSIIWDMKNLKLAYQYGQMIMANTDLLDSSDEEISQYLHNILQDHILYQKNYHSLKSSKLTQWGIDEIIKNTYDSQDLKGKTLKDYRSRILSWFFFAKLLEKTDYSKGQIILPLSNDSTNKRISNIDLKQLELKIEI